MFNDVGWWVFKHVVLAAGPGRYGQAATARPLRLGRDGFGQVARERRIERVADEKPEGGRPHHFLHVVIRRAADFLEERPDEEEGGNGTERPKAKEARTEDARHFFLFCKKKEVTGKKG